MKKLLGCLLAFSAFLVSAQVGAVHVTMLYKASIPVNTQNASERTAALPQALAQVLVKVSGNPQVIDNKSIKSHLSSANTLMQEFGYVASSHAVKPLLLQVDFDPDGVNKLLRDAGVASWGQVRPLILVWLDYEMPKHPPEIITEDSSNLIPTVLKQQADVRGLPIIFPVMDMTDMNAVSVNDITNMAIPALTNAAKRYASDAILIGRIMPSATGYRTHWQLVLGNDQWGWDVTGKGIDAVVTAAVDNVSNALAARYSAVMTNDAKTSVMLKIIGVDQAGDYDQLMNYVKHLPPVIDVQPQQVTGSDVILSLSLRGDEKVLTQAIALGQKLIPQASTTSSSILTYQWKH